MKMAAEDALSKRPADTPFKQQKMKAWQPVLSPGTMIPSFLILGPIFIGIGVAALNASQGVLEYGTKVDELNKDLRYDSVCHDALMRSTCNEMFRENEVLDPFCARGDDRSLDQLNNTCVLTIDIEETMQPPIYIYYELTNFFQNHRRYVKSRSDVQLQGKVDYKIGDVEDCRDGGYLFRDPELPEPFVPGNVRNPCGLIAQSFFTDKIHLCDLNGATTTEQGTADEKNSCAGEEVNWSKEGIAWPSDKDVKFKPTPEDCQNNTQFCRTQEENDLVIDEDFMVWMRTAGLPKFRKLYRRIDSQLESGEYKLIVENNYDVSQFKGTKRIVISTTSWLGGRNDFLGIAYIVVGSICFFIGIAFAIKHQQFKRSTRG